VNVVLEAKVSGFEIVWCDEIALYITSRASYRQHEATHSTEGPSDHGCSVYRLSIEPHGVPNSTVSSNRLVYEIWICKVARSNPGKTNPRPVAKSPGWHYAEASIDDLRLDTAFDLAWHVSLVQKADLCLVRGLQFIASILLEA